MKTYLFILLAVLTGACSQVTFSEIPQVAGGVGPGGGNVANCNGYNGSPSCNIIQVPKIESASTATVSCPADYTMIGCGFLCDDGEQPGGTEMLNPKTCRAHCKNSSTSKATAFCYRGPETNVARVVVNDVPRDTVVQCPASHPQVLGCTTRCVNGNESNNPGGATLTNTGDGCSARCDWPGDRSPQLTAYCGKIPGKYNQVVSRDVPNRSQVTCPAATTMAGGLGMCVNGRTGGFIASDSRQYIGVCNDNLANDEVAAFCIAD